MPLDCRETRDWLRPGGPTCLRPDPTPYHTTTLIVPSVTYCVIYSSTATFSYRNCNSVF
uniref:Uncharacterized protein n=1 Tax=Mesocestoides corti TaxID=53468 RepID=A0A5K3G0H9_MESCO